MRTCVGCGRQDESDRMIRLVLGDDGSVAVDLAARSFGRGAWAHPRPECLVGAARGGAAKSFKSQVRFDGAALCAAVRQAADRRVESLLGYVRGAGKLSAGTEAAREAFESSQASLVVIAEDARAAADAGFVAKAAAAGKVVTWGTKQSIGDAVGRVETAVLAIRDRGFSEAIAQAIALSKMPDPGSPKTDEPAQAEVR